MALDYAKMPEHALAMLFTAAVRDIRKDELRKVDEENPCERIRDLPLHVSQELALRLWLIAGTQKEVERLFYGYEDTGDTAAEGRKQREYEYSRPMPMRRARSAISSWAWGALLTDNDDWWLEIGTWRTRLDAIEAARPILKGLKRRTVTLTHESVEKVSTKVLATFRATLERAAEIEDAENQLRLTRFITSDRCRIQLHLKQFNLTVADLERATGLSHGTNLAH
ncbi:hypothetical protein [Burkholderia gladioli]|uniref:hypothetical protein n=1 Tax=Burkholderia gladioli TaxID=28095 RepID=UPI0016411706|nr:hypothetical protein [Burkholderia gladioli]